MHIMQAVGELYDNHAHIGRHSHKELADGRGFGEAVAGLFGQAAPAVLHKRLRLRYLGDAVHKLSRLFAEPQADVLDADVVAVLHDVVQQRGDERVGV